MKKEFKIEVENNEYENIFIQINLELKDRDKIHYDTLEIIPKNIEYILSTTVTDNKTFSSTLKYLSDDLIFSDNKDKIFYEQILELEKKYSNNDFQMGTKKQLDYLAITNNSLHDYKNNRNVLKEVNLYSDRGYVFGTDWLLKPIEKNDLDFLLDLFK